jgi:hypothetical protein
MANYSELGKLVSDGDLHKVKEVFDDISLEDILYNENMFLFTATKMNFIPIEEYFLGRLKSKNEQS